MKRALLLTLIACAALLVVWHFSIKRQPLGRTAVNEYAAAIDPSLAGQPDGTRIPRGKSQTSAADSESKAGPLQRLLNWFGWSGRAGKDRNAQTIQQAYVAEPQRTDGEGKERDQLQPFISGRVLDETGQPVPGMDISAKSLALFQIPKKAWGDGVSSQARSDESGAYRFDNLPEGEFRVRTMATDLYLPAEIVVRTGVDTADLVVSGERLLSVQGSVKDIKGKPLADVRVVSEQTPPLETSTDENGGFRMQIPVTRSESTYVLRFRLAGYREETRSLNRSQIDSQSTVQQSVMLTPVRVTAVVAGRVSNREGSPLGGQLVSLLGPARFQAVTNQSGEFVVADVEAGQTYKLQVSALNPYRPYVKQVQVGPEGLRNDVVLERGLPASGYLSGRMLDVAGHPLPYFSLWIQSLNPESPAPIQVVADDAGAYAINEVPLGGLSFTTRSQPRFLVNGINVPLGGAENVNLILDWGSYEVIGQVVDLDNRPVPGSRVVLFWSYQSNGVQSLSQREASTDAGGFFRFAQVGRGIHTIRVSVPGFRNAQLQYDVGANPAAPVLRLARIGQTVPVQTESFQ